MTKPRTTKLTFAVTLQQPKGVTIPEMRAFIIEAIKSHEGKAAEADFSDIKCHLTNKEVHYG